MSMVRTSCHEVLDTDGHKSYAQHPFRREESPQLFQVCGVGVVVVVVLTLTRIMIKSAVTGQAPVKKKGCVRDSLTCTVASRRLEQCIRLAPPEDLRLDVCPRQPGHRQSIGPPRPAVREREVDLLGHSTPMPISIYDCLA